MILGGASASKNDYKDNFAGKPDQFRLLYKSNFETQVNCFRFQSWSKLNICWVNLLIVTRKQCEIQGNSKKNIRLKWTAVCLTLDYLTGKVNLWECFALILPPSISPLNISLARKWKHFTLTFKTNPFSSTFSPRCPCLSPWENKSRMSEDFHNSFSPLEVWNLRSKKWNSGVSSSLQ